MRETRKFDLDELVPDFFDVESILYINASGHIEGSCAFQIRGRELYIEDFDPDGTYKLVYHPRLERITSDTPDTSELAGVPDFIAALIPYFLKGDLYMADEPDLAAEARSWYEQSMATLGEKKQATDTNVDTHYAVGWW